MQSKDITAIPEDVLFDICSQLSFKDLIKLSRVCIYFNTITKNYSVELKTKIDLLFTLFHDDQIPNLLKMDENARNQFLENTMNVQKINKTWFLKIFASISQEYCKNKSPINHLGAGLAKYSYVKASCKFNRNDLNKHMHRCVSFVYDILYDVRNSISFYNDQDPMYYFCTIGITPNERIRKYLVGLKQIPLNNLNMGDIIVFKLEDKYKHIGLFLCEWNNIEYIISKLGTNDVYLHPIHHTPTVYGNPFCYDNKAALQPSVIVKLQTAKDELLSHFSSKPHDSQVEKKSTVLPNSGPVFINTLFNTRFSEISLLVKKYALPSHTQPSLEQGLRYAAATNKINDLKLFIKYVNNINAQDQKKDSQKTALHWAMMKGHHDCCRLLIDAGASADIKDASGKKPEYPMKAIQKKTF